MILVVDSGSTKSDWILINDSNATNQFETIGFNPFFHSSEFIANSIQENEALVDVSTSITHVYFYGAGCSSVERKAIIKAGLQLVFTTAIISVDHDLTAAAYSTFTGEPSIACILGTGSNSCYIEDHKVSEAIPSLAFILGDEGSGSFYGKQLLRDFLYLKLPSEINDAFVAKYNLTKEIIFDKVYKQPNSNVFLASFMPFIHEHQSHPYFDKMLVNGMGTFMNTHVKCFSNYKTVPTHFIGSIGFYFEKQLRQAAQNLDIKVGEVVHKPIDGLVRYHLMFK